MLVGLGCTQQVGKDTVAAHLCRSYGFTRVAFADPIRRLLEHMDPPVSGERLSWWMGLEWPSGDPPWEAVKRRPEVRRMLIGLGVGARDVIGEDVWLDVGMRRVDELMAAGGHVVVTDVRFPNEVEAIRDRGGVLVKLTRPGSPPADPRSEQLGDNVWDLEVSNAGTVDELLEFFDELCADVWGVT
jgi:hypothetical protein